MTQRVALVHDWLTGMRGGEYVLEAIAELYPHAELFTLLALPEKISPPLARLKTRTSWLQKVPGAEKRYRHFLPLMPSLIEKFDLTGFDLIISSSHCVAKGVKKSKESTHVSYVHAPMRYMWDRYDEYFGPNKASLMVRTAARLVRKNLQNWDKKVSSPERVDCLIANSQYIAQQIKAAYDREVDHVIYPFADLERFHAPRRVGDSYLMVTAFAPYKRVDLAIEVFNQLRLPLKIVGGGQECESLKKNAGPTVSFLGYLSNEKVAELYSHSRALIFPGVEDFGITPVEAMAAGTPVIAYAQGGALESVTSQTGIFFREQTAESLSQAILKMEQMTEPSHWEKACRFRAQEFNKKRFQTEFLQAVRQACVKNTAGRLT
jgi:glycosyltransferase involved in cell wall biosynthesis